jgi:hypothetical protein
MKRVAIATVCLLILVQLFGSRVDLAQMSTFGADDVLFLQDVRETTFRGLLDLLCDPVTGLPFDICDAENLQIMDSKTSPTNIGLLIVAIVAARDSGAIGESEAEERLGRIAGTLHVMQKCEIPGQALSEASRYFYNWYDLADLDENGAPRPGASTVGFDAQRFVSFVDNANLAVGMMIGAQACRSTKHAARFRALLEPMDLAFFYNKNPYNPHVRLMNHGYRADTGQFAPYDYGILNSEARLGVLVAIVKDNVPKEAWRTMVASKTFYPVEGGEPIGVMKSWGGDLFEYLFSDLFVNELEHAPDSFGENNRRAVVVHIEEARRNGLPIWGWSPSEVPGGWYAEAGVPELGESGYPLSQVSPYSAFLALRYAPQESVECLRRMIDLNSQVYDEGFGFRDSIDPRTGQVCPHLLSLDKGMEAIALHNFLAELEDGTGIWDYFWLYLEAIDRDEDAASLLSEVRFPF